VCLASDPTDGQLYDIDIPSLNAAEALNHLAEQTGAIMLFPYDLAETRQANAVVGRYTLMDALSELLKDSGLSSGLSDKRVIQIALDEPIERKKGEVEMATEKVPFGKKVGTFLASLLIATGASAQEAADADGAEGAEEVIEEILVTGSRIARDSYNVSTPLVALDNVAIQDTGLGSLGEVLIDEIPALFEATSNTNSQSRIGSTGLLQADLRQLGSNRSLTLIDGRRIVQSSFESRAPSLNTIPTGMVERVEVITGGSSAAYGSDAIAGVVNIITQQDKVGFGFETRGGYTTEGGGEEFAINADYGTTFADGRGYLFVAASYDEQRGIKPSDRERANLELDFDYNNSLLCNEWATATGDQCERDITPADWRNRSDNLPGGVFEENSSNPVADGGFWYDDNNVLQTGWVEDRDGFYVLQWELIKVPDEQANAAIKLEYDISETTKAYFQLHYNENTSFNHKTPENYEENDTRATFDRITGEPGTIQPGRISITNPFVPPIIAANSGSDITWDRLMLEVGNITTDNERTTWRSWAGLQGSIDDNWDWDVSFGYGRFEQFQLRSNEIDVLRTRQALDAGFAADGVTIQCNDPDARAAGCVPLNMFGVGSITPAMADWIRVNPITNPVVKQTTVLGFINGDLFDMPAGPVAAVFGAEYLRDEMDLRVTDGLAFGGITFNIVPPFEGSITSTELFSEVSIPLSSRLTADLSARASDYSPPNIDVVFSYTAGLIWEPVDGYILRGNYARAQRAPDLTELLSPRVGDFDSIQDICADATATSTEPGHDNCRLEPGIAATIAANGIFDDDGNGYSPSAGNPELKQETADTYTVGVSLAPSFLEGFQLAVDYYDITIEDAISQIGNHEILAQCFNSTIPFGQPNTFCDAISRNSDGHLIEIIQRQFNLNELRTSGIDVALDYTYDLNSYGSLTLSADYTHIYENEQEFAGIDGVELEVFVNKLDFGVFEDVAVGSLTWQSPEHWRVRWRTAWKGPIVDDGEGRVEDHLARFAANDALCAAGDPGCITNPEVPNFLFYPSYVRHDLSVSYDMVLNNGARLNLYGGVRNVFDDKGPLVPRTGDNIENGVGGFDSKWDGGVGRFVYLGVEMRFDD
jgi:outer membrane receptor protein involved in Fe transport